MASRDTESRREIQVAARKRLAVAKSQASSAAKALKCARGTADSTRKMAEIAKKTADMAAKSKEVAQSQYDDIKKEVTEAEAFLTEAEERFDVVAVKSENDEGLFDVDTDDESDDNESRKKKKQKTGDVETIVVEGCGVPGVNGTYERSDCQYNGVHRYHKDGQREGGDTKYRIYYTSCWKKWFIGVGGSRRYDLYCASASTDAFAEVPPENGWKVCSGAPREVWIGAIDRGVIPIPKLKWL